MKNTITILILLFSFFCNSQEANLIYNWNDTSLVGSWAYDNTYNEIWGFEINNHEFAVIGSTAGTHIFDVSNVQNMKGMFFMCNEFNQSLNNWDVSNVQNMKWIFCSCKKLSKYPKWI